jgi:ATP-binding cassette, subfamily B (MDR/TAP), member 1
MKCCRETDDVRQASSLASGLLIQHLTTSLTCLVLAFVQSWALTLVILATVPVLVVIQGFSQGMASPLLGASLFLSSSSPFHTPLPTPY